MELAADREERQGILAPAGVCQLFALQWSDRRCYVGNLLAAGTGLRSGEVVGLCHFCVHPEYVEVKQGWSPKG